MTGNINICSVPEAHYWVCPETNMVVLSPRRAPCPMPARFGLGCVTRVSQFLKLSSRWHHSLRSQQLRLLARAAALSETQACSGPQGAPGWWGPASLALTQGSFCALLEYWVSLGRYLREQSLEPQLGNRWQTQGLFYDLF